MSGKARASSELSRTGRSTLLSATTWVTTCALAATLLVWPWVTGQQPDVRSALYLSLVVVFIGLAAFSARYPLSGGRNATAGVLILGNGRLAGRLQDELANAAGHPGPNGTPVELGLVEPGPPDLDPERLKTLIMRHGISDVVITDDGLGSREDLTSLLIECKFQGVRVRGAPDFYEDLNKKVWLEALQPQWFICSDVFTPSRAYVGCKRMLDLCSALAVLVVTFPLMMLIALAIKLESAGPILYKQERIGQYGVPFMLYKFRSMREGAEDETGPVWAKENDDRTTRVGRFLRRSHLDELPQVFNVLKNELAFVGPRPERDIFVQKLVEQIPFYRLREYIKPGVTGWAQVSFPYGDTVEAAYEKLQYDLYYAKHASIRFDLEILLSTVRQVVLRRGR